MAFKFTIKATISGAGLFTATLAAKYESESDSVKLGEAVKKAVAAKADLYGADLRSADLRGAVLGGGIKASGARPVFQLGPIGRYGEYITAFVTTSGAYIRSSEFNGTLKDFRAHIAATGARDGAHLEWIAAIHLIAAHAIAYPATPESTP